LRHEIESHSTGVGDDDDPISALLQPQSPATRKKKKESVPGERFDFYTRCVQGLLLKSSSPFLESHPGASTTRSARVVFPEGERLP